MRTPLHGPGNAHEVRRHFEDEGLPLHLCRTDHPSDATAVARWRHRALPSDAYGTADDLLVIARRVPARLDFMALHPRARPTDVELCRATTLLCSRPPRRATSSPLLCVCFAGSLRCRSAHTGDATGRAPMRLHGMASLRDSLAGCVPLPMRRTWPGRSLCSLALSRRREPARRVRAPTAIHRVPPPLDGSSSRTGRGCCTSTGRDSHRFEPTRCARPFPTRHPMNDRPRCACCTPRRSDSPAPQPLPVNRSEERATRCACPLDVSTSSRPCSAKRSQPPAIAFPRPLGR